MRIESKKAKDVQLLNIEHYHGSEFKSLKVFKSDRYKAFESKTDFENYVINQNVYGVEIETECFGSMSNSNVYAEVLQKVIFSHFPDDLFRIERDGSLRSVTIQAECVSQVMTKSFIRNHYNDFKNMYDLYFDSFNISCSRSGNCGMHVNISHSCFGSTKEIQMETIRKFACIVNMYYDLFSKALMRKLEKRDYCCQMYYSRNNIDDTIEFFKNATVVCNNEYDDVLGNGSHGYCFNFSHPGRTELRLVGGQPNYYAFRNTMEVVFWLVEKARKISWNQIKDKTNIFKGCNKYVYKRLSTECQEYFTSEELQTIKDNVNYKDDFDIIRG